MGNVNIMDPADTHTPYHHGDLRQALIDHAWRTLERDGLAKLSLRKLAGLAGVSHNAPYMHFKTKDALLDAVAANGFERLREAIGQAGGSESFTPQTWRPRVLDGLGAYVAFAQKNPALYSLMHRPAQVEGAAVVAAGEGTLDSLSSTLEAGQSMGLVRAGSARDQALWVWSTLHGLAGITSVNREVFGQHGPEEVTSTVLEALLDGLAP